MSQLPLHPLVVHFPIVLACLVPLVAAYAAWNIQTQRRSRRAWWIPFLLQCAVVLSGWLALQTGEQDEERVEAVVAEAALEAHEDMAKQFVAASGGLAVLMAVPLVVESSFLPPFLAVLSLMGVVFMARAGHSGANLVYTENAGAAFAQAGTAATAEQAGEAQEGAGLAGETQEGEAASPQPLNKTQTEPTNQRPAFLRDRHPAEGVPHPEYREKEDADQDDD